MSSLDVSKTVLFVTDACFDSTNCRWWKKIWTGSSAFGKYCTTSDVKIACTVSSKGILAEFVQRSFNQIGHLFFDKPEVADVIPETSKKNRVLREPSDDKFPGTVSANTPAFLQLPQLSSHKLG
ncbi:hypothetical protein JCM5353_001031, partial [Sporobolomyces roseus]